MLFPTVKTPHIQHKSLIQATMVLNYFHIVKKMITKQCHQMSMLALLAIFYE